jgi:uncharacterized SAM-binding protein YcdF (DUF218 family)
MSEGGRAPSAGEGAATAPRALRAARAGVLCLVASTLLAWGGARFLIVRAELASADAIVVLAGSSTYVERTGWAARLYKERRGRIVVLTDDGTQGGWSDSLQRNPFFYELAARELEQRGVPAEKIEVVRRPASGTYQESLRLSEHAAARGWRSLLVVTSAYHTRRALWTLRRVFAGSGVEIGIDSPPPGGQTPSAAVWWLRPQGWALVPGEYAKMIYYGLKYQRGPASDRPSLRSIPPHAPHLAAQRPAFAPHR